MQEAFAAPLAALTTMRVGGPADRLVTAESIDDIVDAVREVDDADEPLLLLSGGSNLVVADDGFRGTVLRIASRGVRVESLDRCSGATVRVAAGEGVAVAGAVGVTTVGACLVQRDDIEARGGKEGLDVRVTRAVGAARACLQIADQTGIPGEGKMSPRHVDD